jgi:hypothetical protein
MTISAPELKSAAANTGATLNVVGMGADDITLEASAKAALSAVAATGTSYHLAATDEGQLNVAGTCETASIEANKAARVQAQALLCNTVDITASDHARAVVYATGSVKADASNGAAIDVLGHPLHVQRQQRSGGTVRVVDAAVTIGVALRAQHSARTPRRVAAPSP